MTTPERMASCPHPSTEDLPTADAVGAILLRGEEADGMSDDNHGGLILNIRNGWMVARRCKVCGELQFQITDAGREELRKS